MAWSILILLVPMILVPVVLLFGFAGCGTLLNISGGDFPIPGPMGLTATATGDRRITLVWNNHPVNTATFKIFRAPLGTPIDPATPIATPGLSLGMTAFEDTDADLGEVITFVYRMEAFNSLGHKLAISNDATVTSSPLAPSEVKATPKDATAIEVTWKNNSLKADRILVSREPLPAGSLVTTEIASTPPLFTSQPLAEGSQHKYQLAALFRGTLNGIPNQEVKSPLTPAVTVIANTFRAAISVGLATDQPNLHGFCIVTRFPAISAPPPEIVLWTKLRITLRGSTAGPLTIDKVTLSRPGDQDNLDPLLPASAKQRWDPASQGLGNESGITTIQTGVGSDGVDTPLGTAVILPANSSKSLIVSYSWHPGMDLLIAFDINPTPGRGNVRFGPVTPAPPKSYFKAPQPPALAPIAQAGTQDRASDFQPSPVHYLVEKIEVS